MCAVDEKLVMKQALDEAIVKAGSQSALAKLVGVKPQAVQQWVKQGFVSRKSAKVVSSRTGVSLDRL